jgi:heme oxygenase (biliverdin-producing, ferredoxin)
MLSAPLVLHLGDLSGGQMPEKLAARQLGLDGHGLAFYEFPGIADAAAFKAEFRRCSTCRAAPSSPARPPAD